MFVTAPEATDLSPNQPEAHPEHPGAYPEHRWNYKARVRGTVYLWGSAGINNDAQFPSPLLLHIRNDTFGEPITVGTETARGSQTTLGTLQAGEQFSIPIQRISAVFATCRYESTVTCWLRKS
jgi:hypothetical protein